MRKNAAAVYAAWLDGRPLRRARSIWTDGESIYSYDTAILARDAANVILNVTKYSQTTTTHQNGLAVALGGHWPIRRPSPAPVLEVDGMPLESTPDDLIRAAA